MPRTKLRERVCQWCGKEYDLSNGLHKYCSVSCRRKWHYNRWKSTGGKRDPDKQKSYWLKHKYGITLGQYRQLLSEQGSSCAICKRTEPTGYNWHVDHSHETGKVRSLLCSNCNQALGLVAERKQTLINMLEYLEKHES